MKRITLFIALLLPLLSFSQLKRITYDFPKKVEAGENYTVKIEIYKYDISKYAQYKQILPSGFVVENLIDADAEFTFENNTISYRWDKLSDDSLIVISYSITADSTLLDAFETKGQFSYIVKNQRGAFTTNSTKVKVTNKYIKKNDIADNKKNNNADSEIEDYDCDVSVKRNIKVLQYKFITVELLISKCNYSGIAFITEKIPDNFTVVNIESEYYTSEFEYGILSFDITKMPESEETFKVTYKLESSDVFYEYPEIFGKYKYLNNAEFENVTILDGANTGKLKTKPIVKVTEEVKVEKKEEVNIETPVIKANSGEDEIIKFLNE